MSIAALYEFADVDDPCDEPNAVSFIPSTPGIVSYAELYDALEIDPKTALVGVSNATNSGYSLLLSASRRENDDGNDGRLEIPPGGVLRLMIYPKNGVLHARSHKREAGVKSKKSKSAVGALMGLFSGRETPSSLMSESYQFGARFFKR